LKRRKIVKSRTQLYIVKITSKKTKVEVQTIKLIIQRNYFRDLSARSLTQLSAFSFVLARKFVACNDTYPYTESQLPWATIYEDCRAQCRE
jgi:hypothetical protein